MNKVLVIGLDGATWDLIAPWVREGELATFKALMERGVWGVLESTIPPWTFPAWESLCTGKNVGKLPFFTFMARDGYRFAPYITKATRPRRFPDVLVENGRRILLANLPNMSSAYEANGLAVAGWFCTSEQELTYPSNLLFELDELLKQQYIVDVVGTRQGERFWKPKRRKNAYLKQIGALLRMHTFAFKHLLSREPWDFGFVVFVTPDRIQHRYWHNETLLEHHKELDLNLKELLDTVNDDTVIFLISDHGFGPVEFTFNVNEWLMEEGYLKLRTGNEGKGLASYLASLLRRSEIQAPAAMLFDLLPLPSRLSRSLLKKASSKGFEALAIDWRNTRAFAYGVFGDIYINLEGREPSGSVKLEEYDGIRNEIIGKLKDLKYPGAGSRLSVDVLKKEDIYENSSVSDNKPDMVILVTNAGIQSISPTVGEARIFAKSSGGEHRLNGCFLACGPDIKKGLRIGAAKIYDIAPTILHMFGLPIPKDMDGQVLTEIFEEGSELARRAIIYQETEPDNEKERIKGKIKGIKASGKI